MKTIHIPHWIFW
uniref:Uncharacterized protein n=1 Tax=Lepeophtheirus salmonis TaxID=72036 RepID=A0A0K2U5P9_LEPSM